MRSNEVGSEESGDPALFTREALVAAGFNGLITFTKLRSGRINELPSVGGIYVVVRESDGEPAFLVRSVGGYFKGVDPTVPISTLEAKWLPGVQCLYIGKANDLRRRVREFMRFGAGRPVGHRGGRYIWQLERSNDLVVAWKATPDLSPRQAEMDLLIEFRKAHGGRLPFGNLVG